MKPNKEITDFHKKNKNEDGSKETNEKISKRETKIVLKRLKGNVGKCGVNGYFSVVLLITDVVIIITQFYYKIIILKLHL